MASNVSSTKRVVLNSGIYSVTSILQKAIGFFLLPLYTLYLTPVDYGITGMIASFTSLLAMLFTLALDGAIARFYYEYKDEPDKLRDFWGTIIVFCLINSFVWGGILFLLKDVLLTPLIKGIAFYPFIMIGLLTIIVSPIYFAYQGMLQIMQKAGSYALNSSLNFVLTVALNIVAVVAFKMGATGVLLSAFISSAGFAAYAVFMMISKKLIRLNFNLKYLYEALKYSLPLIPHLMSVQIASFVSRIFLNNETSTANLGLFNIGFQFLIIVDTIQLSVNNAYIPWFYDLMSRGRKEHFRVINFADLFLRANCVMSLGIALFIKEIIQTMTNPSFLSAWIVVPVMVVAYQIRGIYLFYVNTLFYNKSTTKFIFIATVTGSLTSVILSAFLTSSLGLMTPAIVLIVEKLLTAIIVILISRKYEPVDFKLKKMILYIFILSGATVAGLVYDVQHITGNIEILNVLYKLVIFVVVGIILLKSDYKMIKDTVFGFLNRKKNNGEQNTIEELK